MTASKRPARQARELPDLPITSWAVLGMLSFGKPMTGYDVKKWSDSVLHLFYWSPALSQVYLELRRLEEHGLATSDLVTDNDVRPRRVYQISPEGKTALDLWLDTAPVEPPVLKHTVALRLWLGQRANPERLRQILLEQNERSRELAASAERIRIGSHRYPQYAFQELVAEWAQKYYETEEKSALELLARIEEMTGLTEADELHRDDNPE